jgi:hypothetical protein
MAAATTAGAGDSEASQAALDVPAQGALRISRHRIAVRIALAGEREKRLEVLPNQAMEHRLLGAAAAIHRRGGAADVGHEPCLLAKPVPPLSPRHPKKRARERPISGRMLQELAAQARIVPHFQGGRALGFKLFAIRPESLYAKLGFLDGDCVRRVNGDAIDSPDKALAAYGRLRSASEVVVELVRAGRNIALTYLIR